MPPWTLERLAYEWGDAYLFSYCRDRWVALRRDNRSFITAHTLDLLEGAIRENYRWHPVPRAYDPPGATDYLDEADEPEAAASNPPVNGDDAGARLIALNMALNGTPRDETARYLSQNFDLDDQDSLLDEVYARVGG